MNKGRMGAFQASGVHVGKIRGKREYGLFRNYRSSKIVVCS